MTYDTFLFCNELELLKLRLHELDEVVDRFVLAESRWTHRGNPKPLFYAEHKEEFAPWKDRIDAIEVDMGGLTGDNPKANGLREHAARKALDGYDFEPGSTIVYGDADEIVKPEVIQRYLCLKQNLGLLWCEPKFYHFYLNLLESPTPPGARPVIAPAEVFKDIGFEEARWTHGYSPVTKAPKLTCACWHFAYLGGVADLRYKIACAVEGSSSDWIGRESDETLQARIEAGRQYDGGQQFQFVPVDDSFPRYVRENLEELVQKKLVKPVNPA